jgi:hypothetical protein
MDFGKEAVYENVSKNIPSFKKAENVFQFTKRRPL